MTGLWRILFRENPMQIETLRAIRRFTVTGGKTAAMQRTVARALAGIFVAVYVWFLLTIIAYREDISPGLLWFEFALLTLLVPGSLYTAISGERERLTWDSLILTNLTPARILTGKLLWRLGMAGAILLLFLPPLLITHFAAKYSVAYTLGNMLWIQTCMTAWCVFLAAFTLWISAKTKRSVVTLSVVTVSLLAGLLLVPALAVLFHSGQDGDIFTLNNAEYTPMGLLTSLMLHLNPMFLISTLENQAIQSSRYDFWRDLFQPASLGGQGSAGVGIYTVLPLVYLGLAALCLNRTLKALARLGLPSGATR